jgi:hypothetical protein
MKNRKMLVHVKWVEDNECMMNNDERLTLWGIFITVCNQVLVKNKELK